jgi:putative hemolysin
MTEILIIIGLTLINGLFSMAEIALVSSRKARLESQAAKGDAAAAEALKITEHPDTFLSTVQIGITLIGILLGIFSGEHLKDNVQNFLNHFDWIKPYSGGAATAIVVVFITYLSLVLGELLPKRIGMSNPEGIAKLVAPAMRVIMKITYPFIWLLSQSTNLLARLLGVKTNNNQVTEEEIKAIINEGTEQGTIEEAEQEIIERVFHLGDRSITSLMTHRNDIIWLDEHATVSDVHKKVGAVLFSTYPLCSEKIDGIKGIVSIKDFLFADGETPLKKFMKPALYVPENNTAYQVLERFKESKAHSCFIVDEYGSVLGLITLNNILEAIVGDIPAPNEDAFEITTRADGSYLIDAQIPFYDFLSHFEKTEWMHEGEHDFDTLAGFIIHQLERIPHAGDKMEWNGFDFEIIDMDGQRIDKLLVTLSEELKNEMEEK